MLVVAATKPVARPRPVVSRPSIGWYENCFAGLLVCGANRMATSKMLGYLWTLTAVSLGLIALWILMWVLFAN
jgi:hypothetical protein